MKKAGTSILIIFLTLALAGCGGGGEEQGSEPENGGASPEEQASTQLASNEVVVGGFDMKSPTGREISVPEVTAEREDVENYVQSVRPIIEDTAPDLSQVINPSAELQNETLTLSIEAESIEQARASVENGLQALRQVEPPESLEPIHELLVAAYAQALAAYDNIIEAFGSGDVGELAEAARENLPEIGQFVAQTRIILQELERAETAKSEENQVESRG